MNENLSRRDLIKLGLSAATGMTVSPFLNSCATVQILTESHFSALELFWNEVVQNPLVVQGGIETDAVLVLPRNYGWGMRRPDDTIWGLWDVDEKSQKVWAQLQSSLEAHGLCLDVVYDDAAYPVAGKYSQIYYWNQTS